MSTEAGDASGSTADLWRRRQRPAAIPRPVSLLLTELGHNIEAVVGRENVCEIASRTGIDLRRVVQIIGGDSPDSYELRRLETAYNTSLWPTFDAGRQPDDGR